MAVHNVRALCTAPAVSQWALSESDGGHFAGPGPGPLLQGTIYRQLPVPTRDVHWQLDDHWQTPHTGAHNLLDDDPILQSTNGRSWLAGRGTLLLIFRQRGRASALVPYVIPIEQGDVRV